MTRHKVGDKVETLHVVARRPFWSPGGIVRSVDLSNPETPMYLVEHVSKGLTVRNWYMDMRVRKDRTPEPETYPCKGCDAQISYAELCDECAKWNTDPFFTSKYKGDFTP